MKNELFSFMVLSLHLCGLLIKLTDGFAFLWSQVKQ